MSAIPSIKREVPDVAKAAPTVDEILDASTLFGDTRDAILERLRHLPKPWTVLSEKEQQEWIDSTERVARTLVTRAVHIVAAQGRPTVLATCEKLTLKDGLKAELTASRTDDIVLALNRAVGQTVLIVVTNEDAYLGEKQKAKPDPDQREMVTSDGEVVPLKPRD